MDPVLSKPNVIEDYVRNITKLWNQWSKGYSSPTSRVEDLYKEVLKIYEKLDLVLPKVRLGASEKGFDTTKWQINTGTLGFNMKANVASDVFSSEVQMIYLLACNVEEYWFKVINQLLLERKEDLYTGGYQRPDFLKLVRTLKMPLLTLDMAWKEVCKIPKEEESTYGHFSQRTDYKLIQFALQKALDHVLLNNTPNPGLIKKGVGNTLSNPTWGSTIPIDRIEAIKPDSPLPFVPKDVPPLIAFDQVKIKPIPAILSLPGHNTGIEGNPYIALQGNQWPKYSMTDPEMISKYVNSILNYWPIWRDTKKGDVGALVTELFKILTEVHTSCGLPKVAMESFYDFDGRQLGGFQIASWRLRISTFKSWKRDFDRYIDDERKEKRKYQLW